MNVLNLHISSCLLGVCALICNDMNAKRNGGVYTDMKFAEGDNSTFWKKHDVVEPLRGCFCCFCCCFLLIFFSFFLFSLFNLFNKVLFKKKQKSEFKFMPVLSTNHWTESQTEQSFAELLWIEQFCDCFEVGTCYEYNDSAWCLKPGSKCAIHCNSSSSWICSFD